MERVRMSGELAQDMIIASFRLMKPFSLMMTDGFLKESMGFSREGFGCLRLLGSFLLGGVRRGS